MLNFGFTAEGLWWTSGEGSVLNSSGCSIEGVVEASLTLNPKDVLLGAEYPSRKKVNFFKDCRSI